MINTKINNVKLASIYTAVTTLNNCKSKIKKKSDNVFFAAKDNNRLNIFAKLILKTLIFYLFIYFLEIKFSIRG